MASKLFDKDIFYMLGINPFTGLPIKMEGTGGETLLPDVRRALRIKDEQEYLHRYKWDGLPKGIDALLLERIMYYRGQAMLFRISPDYYLFLPYAISSEHDCYGRPQSFKPLVFNGSMNPGKDAKADDEDKAAKEVAFQDKYYQTVYSDDIPVENPDDYCAILHDYSPQLSDYVLPRQILQEHAIKLEAEALPLARTSMIANSGVKGMRVNDEGASDQVKLAGAAVRKAAMVGDIWVPMVDAVEFQELTENGAETPEGSLMYFQATDNYRRSLLGVDNGGVYEKKAHVLGAEEELNEAATESVLMDGLKHRERFAELANYIFGLSMSVSINEENRPHDKPQDEEEAFKEVKEDVE